MSYSQGRAVRCVWLLSPLWPLPGVMVHTVALGWADSPARGPCGCRNVPAVRFPCSESFLNARDQLSPLKCSIFFTC